MATTAVTTPPAIGGDGANGMTPLEVNSARITVVMQRLAIYCRKHVVDDSKRKEVSKLCLTLSRGFDYALANHVVPNKAQELPSLLTQICQSYGDDQEVQPTIMTLLIAAKGACKSGWYSDHHIEEVMKLVNEIGSNFGTVSPLSSDPSSHHHSIISTIMLRFYPRRKMGQMLFCVDAKPGYGAYLSDFQILKNFKGAPGEKLTLFVVQMDNVETASCLITPPKVNFLLNGKGVEKRTAVFMDSGPQMPTVVRQYLQYGTNLLQAVGEFNGNYIIAMALMSQVTGPGSDGLQDHVAAALDSDPDIIEGPFRISLNCPISFTRIKTPVKGYLCNHIQCFDYDNYMDMNSRCPSWRCPHCRKSVCFTDLRIDQKIVKILKEIGPKVNDIIINSDGSWKNSMGTDDATQQPDGKTSISGEDDTENVSPPTSPFDVLDLTETDEVMDDVVIHETEDRKFDPVLSQNESSVPGTNTCSVNEDNFWSGLYRSTFGAGSSSVQQNNNYCGSALGIESSTTSIPNREIEASPGNSFATNQYGGNPASTTEYGTSAQLQPRNVTTAPVAVQALPSMQTTYSLAVQRSRSTPNTFIRQNSLPTATQGPLLSPVNMNSTIRSSPQLPHLSSTPLSHYPGLQRNTGLQSQNQVQHAYRTSIEHQHSSQRMSNIRMPQPTNQSPRSMQSPSVFTRPQGHVGALPERGSYPSSGVSNQNSQMLADANRAAQMSLDSSRGVSPYSVNSPTGLRMPFQGDHRVNAGATSQPLTRTDSLETPDPNWRPAGRMRGALTGQAYSEAMKQFIIGPTQQAQAHAARPVSNVASLPVNVQSRLADRATQGSPAAAAGPPSNQGT